MQVLWFFLSGVQPIRENSEHCEENKILWSLVSLQLISVGAKLTYFRYKKRENGSGAVAAKILPLRI